MELLERSAKMTAYEEPAWERSRIRVPREDGAFLIQPEPAVITAQLEQLPHQQELNDQADCRILHRQLSEFRSAARHEIISAATHWTSNLFGHSIDAPATGPLIMTGHQPELFHPGVFAKNIATSVLAARAGGVGLNLVVDNDLMTSTQIRVPLGTQDNPSLRAIPFDETRSPLPWEEARVANPSLFASFGDRVADAMSPWGIEPLIKEFWPAVVEKARQSSDAGQDASLAECMTAGRASLERNQGLGNLELPISRLCETDAFRAFASHIILDGERFCRIYNQVLAEYRTVHRIRSSSHPVPELQIENGWCETPFWIWRVDDPRRGRLFVRRSDDSIILATSPDESASVYSLPLSRDIKSDDAVAAMRKLQDEGLHLRTRALTTTLFSRLCLCDLFIHGIGGAKYDAMTDRIASRFFGAGLPTYLTLSATSWLPTGDPHPITATDVSRLRRMMRELQQNPQRFIGPDLPADARSLVTEKLDLIAQQNLSGAESAIEKPALGRKRYRRFPEINRALSQLTLDHQNLIREELAVSEQQLAANQILTSREFSFCLYPVESIRSMISNLETLLSAT